MKLIPLTPNTEGVSMSTLNIFQRSLSTGARPTYWLTRFLILRLLGAIYAIGFLVAINQIHSPDWCKRTSSRGNISESRK